ncbi:accessory factor associated with RNA polymerase II [Kalmusia sp. IMI 367209]|nr:accessory factor associated with RNA polymerase II [Kalmusia sp. IMI 367209]
MATPTQAELDDPLSNLRLSITSSTPPILATTANPSATSDTVTELSQATYISFNAPNHHKTFDITVPTRYAPGDKPIDLRSIYFAWLNKDASVTEYFAAVQQLNEELPGGAGGSVVNLSFAQKIELMSWLSGEVDVSEDIKPVEGAAASAAAGDAAAIAGGKGVPVQKGTAAAGGQKMVDARLLQIYDGERRMGDHNTALRGSKPIDFSAYRKVATTFLRSKPDANPKHAIAQPLVSNLQKKPSRRVEQPIILLSPSASSLLRMSNIKSFLDEGIFIPPNTLDTSSTSILQMKRSLPSICAHEPLRFILVDNTTMFKPNYWSRVVAVFTTGQSWQFKSYKYPNPIDLFAHYPGVYVGWEGEPEPETVKAWGRGVSSVHVDKWTGSEKGRWRDREVVERIWGRIEEGMRRNGWTNYGPGSAAQQQS